MHGMTSVNPNCIAEDWLRKIQALCQKTDITAKQRLDFMLLLRKPYGLDEWQALSDIPFSEYSIDILDTLIKAAKRLDDWPLLIECCRAYQERLEVLNNDGYQLSKSLENLCLLAKAYQQHSCFSSALECLSNASILHYQNTSINGRYQKCQHYIQQLPQESTVLRSDTLWLSPLQTFHMADFFWQYSEDIAELCKLPGFDGERDKEWMHWLKDCHRQPTAQVFAIHHKDWGFVGTVGFDSYLGRGFFYYWLGEDFQGLGIGPQAVELLLNWARRSLALTSCYAITFEDNIPSQKALKKLNFRPVSLKVACSYDEDHEQEFVFYLGEEKADQELFFDLNQLFVDIDSELRVLMLAD